MKTTSSQSLYTRLDLHYKDTDELFVSNRLKYMLGSRDYAVLDDLLLPSDGNTTMAQIDHVIVSIYGVFCIETKSHKGWIFGGNRNAKWTQVLYRKKYPINNPFHQNYGHIKAVESLLRDQLHSPIISLVAFPSADKINVSDTDLVGDIAHVLEKVMSFNIKQYSYSQCTEIIRKLRESNMPDESKHTKHINEIRQLLATV